tara:strand:+ start:1613 stop:2491 length:879 start_codon:yes stop_codon:yes gene_type:complete
MENYKINKKNILILGGSGFLGSHVCDALTNIGHKVTIYDIKSSKWKNKKQKFVKGSLLNKKLLYKLIKNNQIVYNFAGVSDLDVAVKNPISTIKFNILANAEILKICAKHKIKRYVYSSSIYAGSSQGGFYSASKRAAEDYILEFCNSSGIDFTILRYGTVYGPRSNNSNSVKNIINYSITHNKILYPGHNKSVREYIHVKDAAVASAKILSKKYKNKCIMLTGKKSIKIKNFLSTLKKILRIKRKIKFKNKTRYGHYISKPKPHKILTAKKFKFNKVREFEKGIQDLVREN